MNLVEQLCNRYDLSIREHIGAGHICKSTFRVTDSRGVMLILKVGDTPEGVREIIKNCRGYEGLRALHLKCLVPNIEASGTSGREAFILMGDCGDDFVTQLQKERSTRRLYDRLAVQMEAVYRQSRGCGTDGKRSLRAAITKTVEQYERYLGGVLDPERVLAPKFAQVLARTVVTSHYYCFASWDFTPRNIFLTAGGVKYADPNADVTGVPIIDLSCFAGVVRDVEMLPEAAYGYAVLKNLAVNVVGTLLEIEPLRAERIFYLGRVLQSFLGARFRMQTEPSRAVHFFRQGVQYLERVVGEG